MLGCIAVWKPKGVNIAKKYLQNCYASNKDGAGFAYAKDGKVGILKGFFNFEEFYKAYLPFQKYACLLHFRIATHGAVNPENCHPFEMNGGKYALIHNGVLPYSLHDGDKDKSDTKQFAELMETIMPLVDGHWQHEGFSKVVGEAIGYNKVVILRGDGKAWLFNEHKGEWHKGAWYSNNGYNRGSFSRACSRVADGVDNMWHQLGFGTKEQPVWSNLHSQCGYYDEQGEWQAVGEPEQEDDEAVFATLTEEEEEMFDQLTEQELAQLEGDMEFIPENAQEDYVKKWLQLEAAKAKRAISGTPAAEPTGHRRWSSDINCWERYDSELKCWVLEEPKKAKITIKDHAAFPDHDGREHEKPNDFLQTAAKVHPHPFVRQQLCVFNPETQRYEDLEKIPTC